jgi:hypothetical protein
MSYRFYPSNRWSFSSIKETYRDFFREGLSFWTKQTYDIPLQTTLPILGVLLFSESLIQGILSSRHDFLGIFLGKVGWVFGASVFFGFILLMKEWLEARGDFKQYFAFLTYANFIFLPVSIITGVSSNLGRLVGLVGTLWIVFAFYRTFHLLWSRFLILFGIIGGIAVLAFLSTLVAGLKLFV